MTSLVMNTQKQNNLFPKLIKLFNQPSRMEMMVNLILERLELQRQQTLEFNHPHLRRSKTHFFMDTWLAKTGGLTISHDRLLRTGMRPLAELPSNVQPLMMSII